MNSVSTKYLNEFERVKISYSNGFEIGTKMKEQIPKEMIDSVFSWIDQNQAPILILSILGILITDDIPKSSGSYIGFLAGLR